MAKGKFKACLNVGHGAKDKGAVSVGGVSEYNYNIELAELVKPLLEEKGYEVVVMTQSGSYSRLPDEINRLNPDVIISLHFNSSGPSATGTETLYHSGSKNGLRLAKAVQAQMVAAMGLADRGVKSRVKGQRGSLLLRKTKAPCIITEAFFGSNQKDWKRAVERKDRLARAIAAGVCDYLGG